MIRLILVISVFSSVLAAPAESGLFKVVEKDRRTEKLRKNRFVAECKNSSENSKAICYALYDVALSFYAQKLDFTTSDVAIEQDKFCAALSEVLPDSPSSNDSIAAFMSSAQWFKDALKRDSGSEFCNKSCFYYDLQAYEYKLTAACQFLLNQYSFLKNQSTQNIQPALKDDDSKSVVQASGSAEVNPKAKNSSKTEVVKIAPASVQVSFPVPAVSQPSKNLSAPKTVEIPKDSVAKPLPTTSEVVLGEESATNTDSQSASKLQTSPLVPLDASKPANFTAAPIKPAPEVPVVESSNPAVTPELPKSSPKTQENPDVPEIPLDDTNNAESPDTDVFDAADKEPEKIGDNPNYDDDTADDYPDVDPMVKNNPANQPPVNKLPQEPETVAEDVPQKKVEYVNFEEDPDSNFFTYLCALMFLCVLLYILHQNRHKLLALCLEGRRGSRRGRERSRGGSKAAYSKLDCNLEEAIMSKKSLSGKSMDIIY